METDRPGSEAPSEAYLKGIERPGYPIQRTFSLNRHNHPAEAHSVDKLTPVFQDWEGHPGEFFPMSSLLPSGHLHVPPCFLSVRLRQRIQLTNHSFFNPLPLAGALF